MSGRITMLILVVLSLLSVTFFIERAPKVDSSTLEIKHRTLIFDDAAQPHAKSWLVFDPVSGEYIAGKNTEEIVPIASIAKLFAAYVVLTHASDTESVIIDARDVATEGESGKLVIGEHVLLTELLYPLLIESSNDAAATIERVLGNEASRVLNTLSEKHILESTSLEDLSGLSPYTTSNTEDLARFYSHTLHTYPHILDITSLHMYITKHDTGLINNDPLHNLDGFRGGKHGYTPEAGKTFVGSFSIDGEYGEYEVGIVLLDSTDLVADVKEILSHSSVSEQSRESKI
jgi:serine-type D-Ala-D-Ala carboxypeptidase (penicillin-binding protein 5/6)